MSRYRTSPRFDVVASTRRNWSRQQKLGIVAEVGVDGATVSEVARRHGLHANQLFRWRRELATGSADLVSSTTLPAASEVAPPQPPMVPAFVPVTVTPREPAQAPRRTGRIEVVLAGGRTLRVGGDVDTDALVAIVEALEKRR